MAIPTSIESLSSLLLHRPEAVAENDQEIRNVSLQATKETFDKALHSEKSALNLINSLLKELSPASAPVTRSKAKARANAGTEDATLPQFLPTPITSLYLKDMDEQQIWSQLELRNESLCSVLMSLMQGAMAAAVESRNGGFAMEGSDDEDMTMEYLEGMDIDASSDDEDVDSSSEPQTEDDMFDGDEHTVTLKDDSSDITEDGDLKVLDAIENPGQLGSKKRKRSSRTHPELDDGFFSLSEFNAETEQAESRRTSKGNLSRNDEGSEEEEELEEDVDLFGAVDQPDELFDEEDLEGGGQGYVFYKDFFLSPTKRKPTFSTSAVDIEVSVPPREGKVKFHEEVRVKSIKSANRGRSAKDSRMPSLSELWDDGDEDDLIDDLDDVLEGEVEGNMTFDEIVDGDSDDDEDDGDDGDGEDDDNNERDAIERFRNDLFADDEDESLQTNLSTHETRLSSISKQIADLENQNVGEKDWTLMGEATSRKRPHNSLLEENLEYEQTQRPVASVTEAQVSSLEERIKKRILESRFDDVLRRRETNEKAFLPSRFFELTDTKSQKSLSQIYEAEFVEGRDGAENERNAGLKKEHDVLESLWEEICNKLDALCNSHFVPKMPKTTIVAISNLATANLESQIPTNKTNATMLAPEEVFALATPDLRDRTELNPTEKRARRAKERKSRKKARDKLDAASVNFSKGARGKTPSNTVKQAKQAALRTVVKQGKGVTVVANKLSSMDGKSGSKTVAMNVASLKL